MRKFLAALPFIILVLWLLIGPYILLSYEAAFVLSIPLLGIIGIELAVMFVRQAAKHNFRRILKDKDLLCELKQALDELNYYR